MASKLSMHTDNVSANPEFVTTNAKRALPLLPSSARLETIPALKAVIPARAALAGFAQALKQSPISGIAQDAFSVIESVGALQMQGEALELTTALQGCEGCYASDSLARHIATRQMSHENLSGEPVGSTLALDLAAALAGKPTSIRRGDATDVSCTTADENRLNLSSPTGAERLQVLLDNWHGFVQSDSGDLDPLLMAAAANGQWMALRPFSEQNVAVGQLLTSLLLCEEDLLPAPALPLSLYFSRRSSRHWQFLYEAVAHGEHGTWLQFFMTAVAEASIDATTQLMKWEQLNVKMRDVMKELLPKEPTPELLSVCYKPSFGLAELGESGLARRQTATAWMQRLVSAGVLSEVRLGNHKRYINNAVLSLLAS